MKNIRKFCEDNDFEYAENGEIGFGRKCVGIMNKETDCYLNYSEYDLDNGNLIGEHKVARSEAPEHSYHKGCYLAVLLDGISVPEAVEELDEWVGKVIKAGYKITEYQERNSITSLLRGGMPVKQKLLVDP